MVTREKNCIFYDFPVLIIQFRREQERREEATTRKSQKLFVVNFPLTIPDIIEKLGDAFSKYGHIQLVSLSFLFLFCLS